MCVSLSVLCERERERERKRESRACVCVCHISITSITDTLYRLSVGHQVRHKRVVTAVEWTSFFFLLPNCTFALYRTDG